MTKFVVVYKKDGKTKDSYELSDMSQVGMYIYINQPINVVAIRILNS